MWSIVVFSSSEIEFLIYFFFVSLPYMFSSLHNGIDRIRQRQVMWKYDNRNGLEGSGERKNVQFLGSYKSVRHTENIYVITCRLRCLVCGCYRVEKFILLDIPIRARCCSISMSHVMVKIASWYRIVPSGLFLSLSLSLNFSHSLYSYLHNNKDKSK